jgi:predicted nucleic acid-binding protein
LTRIFLDTNFFIYLLEAEGPFLELARHVRARMRERRDEVVTSIFTLGEILVKPMGMGAAQASERFESFFETEGVRLVPFDRAAARSYAAIRQDRSIRVADAIQLACAASARTNMFITNDGALCKKRIDGIDFIVPLERVFL